MLTKMKTQAIPKPTKIVAVGLNYRDHAKELSMNVPSEPCIFMKPATSVIWHGEKIIYPAQSKKVDYEAELAVVIGKTAEKIDKSEVNKYILGYTCANDVTARDLQKKDGQWTRAKSFDTFCPLGPVITDEIDPNNVAVRAFVNGELRQEGHTSSFIFGVEYLVSFISHVMTLNEGDVVLTGTPKGVGPIVVGDKVEIEIEGIGVLCNYVESGVVV